MYIFENGMIIGLEVATVHWFKTINDTKEISE